MPLLLLQGGVYMAQFRNVGFTFDGINAEDLGYYIVSLDSKNSSVLGTNRTIKEEETNNFAKSFQGVKYNDFTFEITITKANKNKALPITEEDIFFLNNWLMKPEDYRIFISHQNRDILYYALFTEMSDVRFAQRTGYITLKMRLSSGCSYSTVAHHNYHVTDSYTTEIYNKSNVEDYVYPDINFITKFHPKKGNIKIINETLGESMEFTDLPTECEFMCYNEGLRQVVSLTEKNLNVQPLFNKKWLRLAYGRNVIRIEGACHMDIFFQNKIAIQN